MISQAPTGSTAVPTRWRRGSGPRRTGLVAAVTATILAATLLAAPNAAAAPPTLSATVSASGAAAGPVTATARISATPTTAAALAGICARNSSGHHYDFPVKAATLTAAGTAITASRTLPVGTYTYWACAKIGTTWHDIGAKRTLRVTPTGTGGTVTTPAPRPVVTTAPTAAAPSGEAMPVGDLPKWKQVFTDDFTTEAAPGSFQRLYGSRWATYHGFNDTYGNGRYDRNFISTKGGLMDFDLRSVNGQPISYAPAPIVTKAWEGQTYGRFTARMRADALPGWKTAWLLWPDSNNWNEGEVDFPESGLTGTMYGFNHCIGTPSKNCYWVNSGARFTDWHTVTIEWAPNKLTYILDGRVLGTTTTSVPSTPMHWILQTETESTKPAPNVAGHLQVDWVAVYTYRP